MDHESANAGYIPTRKCLYRRRCGSCLSTGRRLRHEHRNSGIFPHGIFVRQILMQDAHNLAWKLAATIKNVTPSAHLLSSYTYERRPVAMQNAELSVENWKEAASIPSALGLDPQHATLFSNVIAHSFGSFAPRGLTKSILETGLHLGPSPKQPISHTDVVPFRASFEWVPWAIGSMAAAEGTTDVCIGSITATAVSQRGSRICLCLSS